MWAFWHCNCDLSIKSYPGGILRKETDMSTLKVSRYSIAIAVIVVVFAISPIRVLAHCDSMDGPVVKAAVKALETGNVNLVLIWVQERDSTQIQEAYQKTIAVRKLNTEARELADLWFFETLVRIHRAGEGEPYGSQTCRTGSRAGSPGSGYSTGDSIREATIRPANSRNAGRPFQPV